jgi:hypothetical protein
VCLHAFNIRMHKKHLRMLGELLSVEVEMLRLQHKKTSTGSEKFPLRMNKERVEDIFLTHITSMDSRTNKNLYFHTLEHEGNK